MVKLNNINGNTLILFTALISGVSIFLNSYAIKGFDSSVFTFAKNLVVAIFLFGIIFLLTKFNEIKSLKLTDWKNIAIIGLIGGSIPFLMFFKGLQMTTGTTASFLHKTIFIYALILGVLFLKEKINYKTIAGFIALLLGTFIMIRPDFNLSTGHLLVFGAVLLWSVEYLLSKKILKNLSGNIVAWGRMFFGSIFIFAYLLFTNKQSLIVSMNASQYLWIGLTSFLLLLYVVTFYNGLKTTTLTNATAILTLGAPITAILSWAFGNSISVYDGVGMVLILVGVMLIAYYDQLVSITVGNSVSE